MAGWRTSGRNGWVEIDSNRRKIPNRAPIDPKDVNQINGIYMPKVMQGEMEQPTGAGTPPLDTSASAVASPSVEAEGSK